MMKSGADGTRSLRRGPLGANILVGSSCSDLRLGDSNNMYANGQFGFG